MRGTHVAFVGSHAIHTILPAVSGRAHFRQRPLANTMSLFGSADEAHYYSCGSSLCPHTLLAGADALIYNRCCALLG